MRIKVILNWGRRLGVAQLRIPKDSSSEPSLGAGWAGVRGRELLWIPPSFVLSLCRGHRGVSSKGARTPCSPFIVTAAESEWGCDAPRKKPFFIPVLAAEKEPLSYRSGSGGHFYPC